MAIDIERLAELQQQAEAIKDGSITDIAAARQILRTIDIFLLEHTPALFELRNTAKQAADKLVRGDLPSILPNDCFYETYYAARYRAAGITSGYWDFRPPAPMPQHEPEAAPTTPTEQPAASTTADVPQAPPEVIQIQ